MGNKGIYVHNMKSTRSIRTCGGMKVSPTGKTNLTREKGGSSQK